MSKVKKILVVEAEQLLGASIVSLLSSESDLNVFGCTPDTPAELVDKIIRLQPNVVIIDHATHFIPLIHLLSAQHCCHFRLMLVSIDHDWVDIDNKQQILITKRADLANIIRHGQWQSPRRVLRLKASTCQSS